MRILLVTAGAAGMYCGSCIRDNALATALRAAGQDVLLLPLYTPTLTDERNVSEQRVFFGGISVYLQQQFSLFRKTPWLLDRLWDSSLALSLASGRGVSNKPEQLGELTVSMLAGEQGRQEKEFRKLIHWLKQQSPPDVVHLPNSLLSGLARPLKRELNCPVLCTLQGEHLFLDGLQEQHRRQALELIGANLEFVDAWVAVSEFYADFMVSYLGLPAGRMHVVPLGIDLTGYSDTPRSRSQTFRIGYLARIAPEKGLHLLCEAYGRMRRHLELPPSRLEAAGYLAPQYKSYLQEIREQMDAWGLGEEFHYRGSPHREEKIAFLESLNVLSVPATYDEPKGLFLLEALAAGVPVVQPRRGSFPEILDKTSGGLLVEPDDSESLARGILSLYQDRSLAEEMGRRGFEGVRRHYSAARMAQKSVELYTLLCGRTWTAPARHP